MIYSYECDACGLGICDDYDMGKAPKHVTCPCGEKADRVYSVSVNVPNPTHPARAGRGVKG